MLGARCTDLVFGGAPGRPTKGGRPSTGSGREYLRIFRPLCWGTGASIPPRDPLQLRTGLHVVGASHRPSRPHASHTRGGSQVGGEPPRLLQPRRPSSRWRAPAPPGMSSPGPWTRDTKGSDQGSEPCPGTLEPLRSPLSGSDGAPHSCPRSRVDPRVYIRAAARPFMVGPTM